MVGDCPLNGMARAYSNDLRRKFSQAYDAGEGTLAEVAERFRVSVGWAKKISARRSRTGEVDAPPWRGGRKSRLSPGLRDWIAAQIRQQPDLTLRELQERLEQGPRLHLSLGWIWGCCSSWGWHLEKIAPRPGTR